MQFTNSKTMQALSFYPCCQAWKVVGFSWQWNLNAGFFRVKLMNDPWFLFQRTEAPLFPADCSNAALPWLIDSPWQDACCNFFVVVGVAAANMSFVGSVRAIGLHTAAPPADTTSAIFTRNPKQRVKLRRRRSTQTGKERGYVIFSDIASCLLTFFWLPQDCYTALWFQSLEKDVLPRSVHKINRGLDNER